MREIRLSGSEGGGPESNRVSLPLFELRPSRARNGDEFLRSLFSPALEFLHLEWGRPPNRILNDNTAGQLYGLATMWPSDHEHSMRGGSRGQRLPDRGFFFAKKLVARTCPVGPRHFAVVCRRTAERHNRIALSAPPPARVAPPLLI